MPRNLHIPNLEQAIGEAINVDVFGREKYSVEFTGDTYNVCYGDKNVLCFVETFEGGSQFALLVASLLNKITEEYVNLPDSDGA